MPRTALLAFVLLAALLPSWERPARAATAVDDAVLLRVAQGRALPRRLSPPREAALDRVVGHLGRGEVERAAAVFSGFARGYFRPAHAEDLEPIVLHLLRRGYLEPRPELLEQALRAAWLEERAIGVARHLDQLDEALAERSRGGLQSIAPLELAGLEPNPFVEPYRWLPGRPMKSDTIRQERIVWAKRLVMAQEDAIAARVRLQGLVQAQRETVEELSRAALELLAAGEPFVPAR